MALRLIQHMWGLDDCRVFKIGGVRDLLREFSVSKSFSHKQALARIGPGFGPHRGLFIEPHRPETSSRRTFFCTSYEETHPTRP